MLEDHLDAAASLARAWERALVSPRYTIGEIAAGPEERLLGDLEGLALGDASAVEELMLPALESGEPNRAFAAAVALLEGGGESCAELVKRLGNAKGAAPLKRAMGLTTSSQVNVLLRDVAAHAGDPAQVASALEILAFRQARLGPELRDLLLANDAGVRAAALRVARGPAPAGVPVGALVSKALSAAEPEVRAAAMELGMIHGSRLAWSVAQKAVEAAEPGAGEALLVLAASGEPGDVSRLAELASVDAHRTKALFALGFTGSSTGAEVCLGAMQDPKAAKVAGEAFSAITGLKIEGEYVRAEERNRRREPIPFEDEDLDANLVPGPEDELPMPDMEKVKRWWGANRSRFQATTRYLDGEPLDAAALLRGFESGSARRRPGLALELAIRTRGEWNVETRHWAHVQIAKQSAAAVKPPVMLPFGRLLTV